MPAFPTVVLKLLSLLGSERSSMASIAACIAADPIIAGHLIQRANAADIAYPEVRDVLRAMVALGVERTREVALVGATFAYMGSAVQMELLRPCWHHGVATAILASEIAACCGLPPDECYTAGLLHDIGRLGLVSAYPAEYEEILNRPFESPDGLRSFERKCFGVDHAEAGRWLARKWNLPDSIGEIAGGHHEPFSGVLDPLGVVRIACRMADAIGFAVGRTGAPPDFEEVAAPLPPPMRDRLWNGIPALQDTILDQIAFFGKVERPAVPALEVHVDDEDDPFADGLLPPAPAGLPAASRGGRHTAARLLVLACLLLAVLWIARDRFPPVRNALAALESFLGIAPAPVP